MLFLPLKRFFEHKIEMVESFWIIKPNLEIAKPDPEVMVAIEVVPRLPQTHPRNCGSYRTPAAIELVPTAKVYLVSSMISSSIWDKTI